MAGSSDNKNVTIGYETALAETIKYLNGNELGAKAFVGKYAMKDNNGNLLETTPDDMHRRMAAEFARIESKYGNALSADSIYQRFHKFKELIPQGSPMAGIGNPHQLLSLGNCFVIPSCQDSYGSILNTDQRQAQIMKRRGGVGHDISNIRPRGLPTANAASTTDGIGVFMERFSNTCREVAQGGRRGALMLTISCHHPEIETFINIKRDLKKVTGANISVRWSDEFLNAIVEDRDVELRWPVNSKTPKITKRVIARDIWKQFVHAAWDSAEPGGLFWDTVTSQTPSDCYSDVGFESISTNPCQPAWATVLTPDGIRTLGQVSVGDTIWSGNQWTKIIRKVATGVKPVYAYKTRAGVFYGTENHRVVSNGVKVEAALAESIDITQGPPPDAEPLDPQDIMDGLVWGDGTFHRASNKVFLLIGQDDNCYFDSEVKHLILGHRSGDKPTMWMVKTRHQSLKKTYERSLHADWLCSLSKKEIRGFLRGLYTANGSVVGQRVQLKSSCRELVEQVQMMLSALGIASYYTTNKAHDVEFDNGTYECKESYDLNIGTKHGRMLFQQLIGFIHPAKQDKLAASLDIGNSSKQPKVTYDIVETENLDEEMVFDITVDAPEHTYWTGGLLVSNCGEIILEAWGACRLLLVNCMGFLNEGVPPESPDRFDFQKFAAACYDAQRLMDDLVDLELEAIDKIIAKIKNDPEDDDTKQPELNLWTNISRVCAQGRRTGLGLTGVGDLVAAVGLRYGSQESIEYIDRLYKVMAVNAFRSSVDMAMQRGSFPVYDYGKEKDHPFLTRVLEASNQYDYLGPVYRDRYLKYGRRNIADTTTPPAGTTSMLALVSEKHNIHGTTSGIEPAYLISYKRRKKINPNDVDARVDYVDELGDKWTEFEVRHGGYERWCKEQRECGAAENLISPENSPYWKATSADVDWKMSVDLQAAAQKWIAHSISKTCNLPKDATEELVSEVYLRAWKSGCKGFTVYRDGSRSGVLVSSTESSTANKDKQQSFGSLVNHAAKRPNELACDVYHSTVQGEKWTIFVGKLDDRPYEIMGGLSKFIKIPKRVKAGKLSKHNGDINPARYDFHFDYEELPEDEMVISDVGNIFENPVHSGYTRMLSLSMRHGVPVQFIVEQLTKAGDRESDLFSISKVLARVLKNYIVDGTKIQSNSKKCSECGSKSLAYKDGCVQCLDCGYSRCS